MDWTRHVDAYCERLSAAFWAEPFNALSNLSFILAALIALAIARRRGELDGAITTLALVTLLVGIASFLFHTVAEVWAGLADSLSIQVFILVYFFLAMRRFASLSVLLSIIATAAFMAVSVAGGGVLSPLVGDRLNGSEGYLPPLAALVVVGGLLVRAGRAGAGWSLIAGAGLFAVSLVFRSVDMVVCEHFPLGTHFVWHLLNGGLLGFLIVRMAHYGRRAGA